jgi:hypothetical protein
VIRESHRARGNTEGETLDPGQNEVRGAPVRPIRLTRFITYPHAVRAAAARLVEVACIAQLLESGWYLGPSRYRAYRKAMQSQPRQTLPDTVADRLLLTDWRRLRDAVLP